MRIPAKLVCLHAVIAVRAFATLISLSGPTTNNGTPCTPSQSGCIRGDPALYELYGVQITQPTMSDPLWKLTMETNYPTVISGNTIPPAQGFDGLLYSTSDFIMTWGGNDYGIVLAQHIQGGNTVDSYLPGHLYQAPNTTPDLVPSGFANTTGQPGVLPGSSNPDFPVWLAAGGTELGTGTVTVTQGGSGTPAAYTITVEFSAPQSFLSKTPVTIEASSWVCANGVIAGTGQFPGGTGSTVPEPTSGFLIGPGLVALALKWRKYHARTRS